MTYENPDGEDTKVLDDVSLDIKKGSTVGILGMTDRKSVV